MINSFSRSPNHINIEGEDHLPSDEFFECQTTPGRSVKCIEARRRRECLIGARLHGKSNAVLCATLQQCEIVHLATVAETRLTGCII